MGSKKSLGFHIADRFRTIFYVVLLESIPNHASFFLVYQALHCMKHYTMMHPVGAAKQSKAKQSNANHAYCFALPCLARGVSHSKAKQCKAKRKTAVGYIALLCFEQSNARQGKAVFFFALHCFALL